MRFKRTSSICGPTAPTRSESWASQQAATLGGMAALSAAGDEASSVQFAVLGYSITSMETETYRPGRLVPIGENASPDLRRATSLDALVTPQAPPFFLWHTAEDPYVPPEHTYRLASALAANQVPHTVHVFPHGPHGLGLAQGAGEAETWRVFAANFIAEQVNSHRRGGA